MIDIAVTVSTASETLEIGRRGENNVRQVIFDLNYLIDNFGNGTATLLHRRHDDEEPYLASDVTQEDDTLTWLITDTDTTYVGLGQCEIRWTVEDGLAKSVIYTTKVLRSLADSDEEIPEAYQSWYDAMIEYIDTQIGTVETAVETNASDIDALETSVATNTGNIAANTANIESLGTRMTTAENKLDSLITTGSITLSTSWTATDSLYSQAVTISDVTENSKIDLQPSAEVMAQMTEDGTTAMWAENDNGTVTVYAMGSAPSVSMTVQYSKTEVTA